MKVQIDELLWKTCQHLMQGVRPDKLPFLVGHIGRVKVFIVDGNHVKVKWDMDFVEGNNSEESPQFIPKDTIWIDAQIAPVNWAPILYHEAHESRDMRHGKTYEKAHEEANAHEKVLRTRLGLV